MRFYTRWSSASMCSACCQKGSRNIIRCVCACVRVYVFFLKCWIKPAGGVREQVTELSYNKHTQHAKIQCSSNLQKCWSVYSKLNVIMADVPVCIFICFSVIDVIVSVSALLRVSQAYKAVSVCLSVCLSVWSSVFHVLSQWYCGWQQKPPF